LPATLPAGFLALSLTTVLPALPADILLVALFLLAALGFAGLLLDFVACFRAVIRLLPDCR
jgi:hypothetical protein